MQAVVFDLDDTLYPERAFVFSGFRAVAAWADQYLGIPMDEGFVELCKLFDQGIRGDIFNRWLKRHGLEPDAWVSRMVQIYRRHNPNIMPYPQVPELLQRLRRRYRLGLVSDGYLEVQRNKLASLKLTSYFDAVVFSDERGPEVWKPSVWPFKTILAKLGVTGSEAVYVADNPVKDFLGARQAGMWTTRVRWPDGLYRHLEPLSAEGAPDFEIETLSVLEPILAQIEKRN